MLSLSFQVQEQSKTRPLVLVGGFIHDLSSFMDQHPGGRGLLSSHIGKDATTAFLGGVYEHSHAAHNVRLTETNSTGHEILTRSCVFSCWP